MLNRVSLPSESQCSQSLQTMILLAGVLVLSLLLDVDAKSARLGSLTGPLVWLVNLGMRTFAPGVG